MPRIGDSLDDVTYPVRRGARRLTEGLADAWYNRSLQFRQRFAAALGLVLLYVLIKAIVVPALPCSLPGGDTCAPPQEAAKLVPGDALLYAHVDVDRGSQQFSAAESLTKQFPHAQALIRTGLDSLPVPSGGQIDVQRDVQPWLGAEAALERVAGPAAGKAKVKGKGKGKGKKGGAPAAAGPSTALLLAEKNSNSALSFADRIAPGTAQQVNYQGVQLRSYGKGFAAAIVKDFLVLGDAPAVRRSIDMTRTPGTALAASAAARVVREPLPANRVADVYLSQQGVQTLLANRGGYAGQLDTFTDFSATRAIAGSAQAQGDGMKFQLESNLDPVLAKAHPAFFAAFPEFKASLAKDVSDQALVYFGVSHLGSGLGALVATAGKASPALAKSLKSFQSRLAAKAKLNLAAEVLPLLNGESAIAIEPTAQIPYAALIADGVDERRAGAAFAKLAGPIARAASGGGTITQTEIEGVRASSIRLSPSANLTFAAFDGKLVVATDPAGVKEVVAGTHSLSGSDPYKKARQKVGGSGSALVFLNLDELFGLAERAGLAANPAYATFSEDIAKLQALGINVSSERDLLSTKFFLSID